MVTNLDSVITNTSLYVTFLTFLVTTLSTNFGTEVKNLSSNVTNLFICVKGCGDLRDINFIRVGLQFASERFL